MRLKLIGVIGQLGFGNDIEELVGPVFASEEEANDWANNDGAQVIQDFWFANYALPNLSYFTNDYV